MGSSSCVCSGGQGADVGATRPQPTADGVSGPEKANDDVGAGLGRALKAGEKRKRHGRSLTGCVDVVVHGFDGRQCVEGDDDQLRFLDECDGVCADGSDLSDDRLAVHGSYRNGVGTLDQVDEQSGPGCRFAVDDVLPVRVITCRFRLLEGSLIKEVGPRIGCLASGSS